ncbi:RICIN domain-containing protein [Streptomyces rubellomurinus]|uniref:RICIN domain-containing protein n=1 Tax=Streptomyces rubellomurinus (strain ATCC 31215) TaxID=359131 RepID=UPI0006976BEE|nr:RICIN domain-containing protein [Streptomyces rubellomurinus]
MGHRSSELRRRRRRRLTRRSALVAAVVAAGLVVGTLGIRTALEPTSAHSTVTAADVVGDQAGVVPDGDGSGETGTAEGGSKPPAPKRDEKAAPPKSIPKDQPERGLVYAGLNLPASDRCGSMLEVSGSTQCSHGPDVPPKDVDIRKDVPPVAAPAAQPPALTPPADVRAPAAADLLKGGEPVLDVQQKALLDGSGGSGGGAAPAGSGLICEGDGRSGNRVQVVYVHTPGNDRYAQYLASFKKWAVDVDVIYNASAAETGGERHVRFVTEPDCSASVLNVQISDAEAADFNASNRALAAQGFDRKDRKYMMFTDAKVYCGIGTFAGDERPGQDNLSNFGPSYGRTDAGCWGGTTAAHELGHNLGAVNNSAPNSSKAGHCVDEWDIMCYSDAPYYPQMRTVCPDRAHDDRLDCNHDDYYNTDPKPGSYLATHWNVANNRFLVAGGGTGPNPNPTPTPTPTGSPTRTPSPTPTPTGSPTATPTGSPSPTASPTRGGDTGPDLTVSQVTQNSAVLSWKAAPAAAGYDVQLNGQTVGTVRSTVVGLVRLAPGTSYTVAVAARDAAGSVGRPGRAVTFHTLADAGHPQPGTRYTMVNGLTGQAADLWGSSLNDGTVAIAYQRTGYANQKWSFEDAGNGAVRIKSVRSGKCLQLGGAAVAGQYVAQQPCADTAAQKWQLNAAGGGFTVTADGGSLVLGLSDRWYYGGWLLELQQPSGQPYQNWSLVKTS